MPVGQWTWVTLAEGFPPSLVTNRPKTQLEPNQTPYAVGLSISDEGFIVGGTIPTATTRIVKSYTIGSDTYEWHYHRLWRLNASSSIVHYGAPVYTATYYRQGRGEIDFNEDTPVFLKMLPIGQTGMIFLKSTGAFIVPNAADEQANFIYSDLIQEAKISTATHAIELDGIVYVANTSGVYAIDINANVTEISEPIRGQITPAAITADYRNKYVIVGTSYVYDVNYKRWLYYSGSTFQYDSPRLRASEQTTPLAVRDIAFDFDWASGVDDETLVSLEFAYQTEDRGWSETQGLNVRKTREQHVHVHQRIAPDSGREWQMRVVTLPSQLKLKRIAAEVQGFTAESRDT